MIFLKIQTGNITPEVNKDKTIEVEQILFQNGDKVSIDSTLAAYYSQLKEPEYVARYNSQFFRIHNGYKIIYSPAAYINSDFFNIFKFKYIAGRPFSKDEEINKIPVLVITKEYAESFFGRVNVLGESIEILGNKFKIIGIVEGPNNFSRFSNGRLYIPYTLNNIPRRNAYPWYNIFLKAKNKESLPKISEELNRLHRQLFKQGAIKSEPAETEWKSMKDKVSNSLYISIIALIIIQLLIPAFTIISLNSGKIMDQMVEFSIKRAYGASRRIIFYEIFKENTIVTLIGSILGLILTPITFMGVAKLINDNLSTGNYKITFSIPANVLDGYMITELFALILIFSLLSCFYPALKVVNAVIADELKGGINE